MSKHSPGPWKWEPDSSPPELLDAGGREITRCPGLGRYDGRLIAAAPEMLVAMKHLLNVLHSGDKVTAELDACALLTRIEDGP